MKVPTRLAKKLATRTNQHVAIAFRGNALVNYANNIKGKVHAEMRALSPLLFETSGFPTNVVVVSLRINRNGNLAMAKPCRVCEKMMKIYGVRKVFFSNRSGQIERL
jgi:hypothetical protein